MSRLDEQFTDQFHRWEQRGRGWQVFDEPVRPEPPFRPFYGHYLPYEPPIDDGRKPTALSSFIQRLSRKLSTEPPPPADAPTVEEEPEPQQLIRDSLLEVHTSLPVDLNTSEEAFEQFLLSLSLCREPIAFELLGVSQKVTVQFATHKTDAPLVCRQLQAHFPDGVFQAQESTLEDTWDACPGEDILVVDFGLAHEFMLPLATGKLDAFIGIIGALTELQPDEFGLFQVLFQPANQPWSESITRSVTYDDDRPFFVNAPELAKAAALKVARPLYAAVVRIAIRSKGFERTLQLARDFASSLRLFAHPKGNELIPLINTDYPFEDHIDDVIRRQSRRSGMLLNSDELLGFVHLPSSAVRSPVLQRQTTKTKAAPAIVRQTNGLLLGTNVHAGQSVPVRLTPEQRVRHTHIIGASGTGKSTLLLNLIRQDIENGQGIAVLDPHGDLVERILEIIPPERIGDVVLVDPSDEQYSVGFNILSAHSDLEKNLLSSDLVSVFQRLSTSWGDQMGSVLQNAILAFLESPRRGTLADLRRFLIEPAFRTEFLKTVQDTELIYYWQKGFPQLSGNKSIGSVITRLNMFLSQKPIRYMVSQPENRLDFADIMDTGKIFLAKLSHGLLGNENSSLLGSLFVSKFQQHAMARQSQQMARRKNFWLYIDECHHFVTPSMAEILAGARKYRLGLVLAHQQLSQLDRDRDVSSAVMSNCYTRVVFRVGDNDARKIAEGFASFEARDLQKLENYEAVTRVERSDYDFNVAVPLPDVADPTEAANLRQEVISASRRKYATPRAELEALLHQSQEQPSRKPSDPSGPAGTPPPAARPPDSPQVAPTAASRKESALPKASEVPQEPEPDALTSKPTTVQTGEGIGGHRHNVVRRRIEDAARLLGFHAERERETASGQKIDLALERPGQFIGCEISFTTTIDHEVGNVRKCLASGCDHIAIICGSEPRLAKIQQDVVAIFAAADASRVGYYLPEQFLSLLPELARQETATKPSKTMRLGKYAVNRHGPSLTAGERLAREEIAHQLMAEAIKQQK